MIESLLLGDLAKLQISGDLSPFNINLPVAFRGVDQARQGLFEQFQVGVRHGT
ncbi:MAG: hypothetical protein AAF982_03850 [Pseudomonadota bacterium]